MLHPRGVWALASVVLLQGKDPIVPSWSDHTAEHLSLLFLLESWFCLGRWVVGFHTPPPLRTVSLLDACDLI